MKRILFLLSFLFYSNCAIASESESADKFDNAIMRFLSAAIIDESVVSVLKNEKTAQSFFSCKRKEINGLLTRLEKLVDKMYASNITLAHDVALELHSEMDELLTQLEQNSE